MGKIIAAMAFAVAISSIGVFAQVPGAERLVGVWQGTIPQYGTRVTLSVTSVTGEVIVGKFGYTSGAETTSLKSVKSDGQGGFVIGYDQLNGSLKVKFNGKGELEGDACTRKCSAVLLAK